MSLRLYHKPDRNFFIDDFHPFTVTFDGRLPGNISKKIYLRNDDTRLFYTNIKVQPIDTLDTNIVNGSEKSFFWKLAERDLVPTFEEWNLISSGNEISISSNIGDEFLGDIVTFIPIWVQVNIPRGLDVQVIKDVVLRIMATENLV